MEGESITYDSKRQGVPDVRLIHYNDVYHVEAGSRDPVGGIARFQTACDTYRNGEAYKDHPKVLTLFSGDAFNPSLESSVTKGSHMVPVLNHIGTNVACVGNHDLDFGVPKFSELAAQCTFPWLLANVLDPALGPDAPLGHAQPTMMLTSSNGIKIGVVGLVEREWLDTINSLPPNLTYKSASATALEWAPKLRADGAEMIIALTHQREPNDNKIAEKLPPGTVDLILGGHDHFYGHAIIKGTHLLRSGTDFKQLSYIEAWRRPSADAAPRWDFSIHRRDIVRSLAEEARAAALVGQLSSKLKAKLEKPIGYTAAPLDARFTTVRLRESNLGNFTCDIMRLYYGADCALMAAGTIRGDQVYPPGVLRIKDIMNCYPFEDPVVVLRVSGRGLWAALENSVSTYPAQEGRFPQVSNIRLAFDARAPPGHRLTEVAVGGAPLDLERKYTLATRDYMARGKDGFDSLLYAENGGPAETVVSEENGMLLSMLLRQYFTSLRVVAAMQSLRRDRTGGEPDAGAASAATEPRSSPAAKHSHARDAQQAHWKGRVHAALHAAHPLKHPSHAPTPVRGSSPVRGAAGASTLVPRHVSAYTFHTGHSDSEDEEEDGAAEESPAAAPSVAVPAAPASASWAAHADVTPADRRALLARRTLRHWRRVARIHRHPDPAHDEQEDIGLEGAWTRGVAPRVEGRIIIHNEVAR